MNDSGGHKPNCGGNNECRCGMIPNTETVEIAKTNDEGKLPLAWLPWAALREVSSVQAFGHAKYKDFNNYRKGMEVSRNASCALRHITEYIEGESIDHESGQKHLAHAVCRLLFILQNEAEGTAIDDRFKGAK